MTGRVFFSWSVVGRTERRASIGKFKHFISFADPRSLQLCTKHLQAKDSLFKQASKKGKDLLEKLTAMETNARDELLDHIQNFCETFLDS